MRLPYTVWEWTSDNGWQLFLASSSLPSAAQVARALKTYQPQKYYATSGPYDLTEAHPIMGTYRGKRLLWGYSPTKMTGWISVYALSKMLPHEVGVFSDREVTNDMPEMYLTYLNLRMHGYA